VVLENHVKTAGANEAQESGWSRVIGTPREFKGHLKVLACDAGGVQDWVLQKRTLQDFIKNYGRRRVFRCTAGRWRGSGL
jgi:ribosomal protein RSM22 (predicted rRNA methylase)